MRVCERERETERERGGESEHRVHPGPGWRSCTLPPLAPKLTLVIILVVLLLVLCLASEPPDSLGDELLAEGKGHVNLRVNLLLKLLGLSGGGGREGGEG